VSEERQSSTRPRRVSTHHRCALDYFCLLSTVPGILPGTGICALFAGFCPAYLGA
jgi:hypothetical protein